MSYTVVSQKLLIKQVKEFIKSYYKTSLAPDEKDLYNCLRGYFGMLKDLDDKGIKLFLDINIHRVR